MYYLCIIVYYSVLYIILKNRVISSIMYYRDRAKKLDHNK